MTMRSTRMLTAVVAVIVLGVSLTACSTADTGESGTPSADGVFPVVIDHIYGSTTVPEKPTRIVTLGVSDADAVIALGTVPVGNTGYTFYETGLGPWTDELVGDAPLTLLGSESEPNFELIASLAPDLITGLNAGFDEATYAKLSDIAPTIARPAGSAAYAVDREVATDTISRAMGESERGEELNAQTTALLEQVRTEHPEFAGRTAAVVLPYDGQFGAFLPGDARGTFVTSLGLKVPEPILAQDDGTNFFVPVSLENISMLDADVVLYLGTGEPIDVVAENPIFGTLKAARNDAILPLSTDQRGAITYNSVLSIPFAIDAVVPRVADALT
ncbi:iron ABC transporter substrate-binding protein [Rhodococcus sp. 06-412-2C]|uniref:ABC transporter substrate-binding protein n=1 Tax=unclassified Rhodococcus (in: high G+C Gram-positive bacteria) TaxID=192944 RepID=UPI000B9B19AE|nr:MULTISPECIES: iron-siderophore ABC transporter substrate-binding protein [unclassified Rhodococcus (in: high G+C Gram-positive bacteria)]OZC91711.1 iron ABC transporter substrate-binding protein [Rhodococcus sp. 06-412-2C]OZC92279.1 iron ABC transporter substrate-binding protein [Rhodococcus sp. 06-412-2B]